MDKRLKVLVSAYACESGKGSEPGVGWNWVKQIARFHDVWVITRSNNRESIEKGVGDEASVNWLYIDLPPWMKFWKKGQRGVHFYYYIWQIAAYFAARRLHKEIKFDVAHHITFGVYWMPSFLALLPVPFVFGPLGGAESAPREFYRSFGLRGRLYEFLRNAARLAGEYDPNVLMSLRRASIVLAKVGETAERVSLLGAREVRVYPESGISMRELALTGPAEPETRGRFAAVSVGRLLHWKGFHLGIEAFSRFSRQFPDSEYLIIGDGPEQRSLKALAGEHSVADKVRFLGGMPRDETLRIVSRCRVLIHPSLHDSGGWACLEAMALGKPVLCLDIGGPGMQVTEETGFKLQAGSPEQVVNDLARALTLLARDSDLAADMGEAARKRVYEFFEWDRKGEWIQKIYRELVI